MPADAIADLYRRSIIIDSLNISNWHSDNVFADLHAGGLTATSATVATWEGFVETADAVAAWYERFRMRSAQIRPVRSVADIHAAKAEDRVGIILSFQNATPIENDLRRLELFAQKGRVRVYDDFAHHPTEIRSTLQALRHRVGAQRIVAVVEPRTHTMSLGALRKDLAHCCAPADEVIWYRARNIRWDLNELVRKSVVPATLLDDIDAIVERVTRPTRRATHVVMMSNGNFGGMRQKLARALGSA